MNHKIKLPCGRHLWLYFDPEEDIIVEAGTSKTHDTHLGYLTKEAACDLVRRSDPDDRPDGSQRKVSHRLFRVKSPFFVAGFLVKGQQVTHAAPNIAYLKQENLTEALACCARRGFTVKETSSLEIRSET